METSYCLLADVLRRFDPTIDPTDLDNDDLLGLNSLEKAEAAIENKTNEFENKTRHAFRTQRVGSPGYPESYEYHGERYEKFRRGVKVYLNHRHVLPLDSQKGDAFEVRVGRFNWRDLTDEVDSRYNANYEKGWIRVYAGFRTPARWNREIEDRNIRISYRYGSLGGNRERGGQTTLSTAVSDTDTTFEVTEAARLPNHALVSVGGTEYARYSSLDYGADELTGVSRGVRNTEATSHPAGTVVHYVPVDVREAVAAGVAAELTAYDDWTNIIVESGDSMRMRDKHEMWTNEFEQTTARHSEVRMIGF